jgi:hypothetical protein
MKTIDSVIDELNNIGFNNLHPSIPARDIKILKNIANLMVSPSYITENQGRLLLKIFNENLVHLDLVYDNIHFYVQNPMWKKPFRVQEKIREVFIENDKNTNFRIVIRYTFDKEIKKVLGILNKKIGISGFGGDNKTQHYTLNEKNLITVYDLLNPLKFHFSTEFLDLHEKTKNIELESTLQKYEFDNFIKNKPFSNLEQESALVILDQKIQYQYIFTQEFDKNVQNTLVYKIASRNNNKIYLSSLTTDFTSLIESLRSLKRSKILLIFDDFRISECLTHMHTVKNSLEDLRIDSVGIYFRFDNKGEGETFNRIISENKFNKKLDATTEIVGISNGKMPKFILKTDWYPDAVISFTSSLRNNKTDVYCNDCDLIVYYTDVKPLLSSVDEIL